MVAAIRLSEMRQTLRDIYAGAGLLTAIRQDIQDMATDIAAGAQRADRLASGRPKAG